MKNSFRKLFRDYYRFKKNDRIGILLLSTLVIIFIIATIIVDNIQLKRDNNFSELKNAIDKWKSESQNPITRNLSLFEFNPNTISEQKIDSLLLPEFVKNNILRYRKAGGRFDNSFDLRKIYGMNDSIFAAIEKYISIPHQKQADDYRQEKSKQVDSPPKSFSGSFNPNDADLSILKKFGFNAFQSSNLLKYRESGGTFSAPHDVLKIYGVDSVFYSQIEKHIKIEPIEKITEQKKNNNSIKNAEINIELNSADSARLIKLSGIGSVFASRIIKYRNLLGGFYSTEQLLEVYNFPEETYSQIKHNIYVDKEQIKKMRINFADYSELIRHPYLESEQVKAILEYRNANGAIQSLEQLEDSGIIEPEKVNKIRYYLSCR